MSTCEQIALFDLKVKPTGVKGYSDPAVVDRVNRYLDKYADDVEFYCIEPGPTACPLCGRSGAVVTL